MTCLVTLKAPLMSACDAITAAMAARPTSGSVSQSGAMWKKGFCTAAGSASSSAPWPK